MGRGGVGTRMDGVQCRLNVKGTGHVTRFTSKCVTSESFHTSMRTVRERGCERRKSTGWAGHSEGLPPAGVQGFRGLSGAVSGFIAP